MRHPHCPAPRDGRANSPVVLFRRCTPPREDGTPPQNITHGEAEARATLTRTEPRSATRTSRDAYSQPDARCMDEVAHGSGERRKANDHSKRTNAQAPKPILTRCENTDRTERSAERTLTYWQVSTRRGATDARQSDHLHTPQASRNGIRGRTPETRRGQDERRRDANAEGAKMERCPEGNGTTLQTRRTETRGEPTGTPGRAAVSGTKWCRRPHERRTKVPRTSSGRPTTHESKGR